MARSEIQPLVVPADEIIPGREPFHQNRWRCFTAPEQSATTLGPSARLEMSIVRARDLIGSDVTVVMEPASDPFVRMYVDDIAMFETEARPHTRNPEWQFFCVLDITAAVSMVRLQVLDKDTFTDDDEIGFVEFCVCDIPFSEVVEGWFELRFQENLRRNSTERYAEHCAARDDSVHGMLPRGRNGDDRGGRSDFDTRFRKARSYKPQSVLSSCVSAVAAMNDDERYNAGEIHVRMRLVPGGSWLDTFFSLALQPTPQDFGIAAQDDLSDLVLQELYDSAMDIKRHAYDYGLVCVMNAISYVLCWRSCLLSTLVLLEFLATVMFSFVEPHPSLVCSIWLGCSALFLMLLGVESWRLEMTMGGTNAPLNEEGFALTAAWSDVGQMYSFLVRVIENLQGSIGDDQELLALAARCFYKGKPALSWAQLYDMLSNVDWLSFTTGTLDYGTLVLVDEFRRARVMNVKGNLVDVEYEDAEVGESKRDLVEQDRLGLRPVMRTIPKWAVPGITEGYIRLLFIWIADWRKFICPLCDSIADIIAWRSFCVSLFITLLLALTSAGCAWLYVSQSRVGFKFVQLVQRSAEVAVGILGVLVLIMRARWMVPWTSFAVACYRLCARRRHAPYVWAFFQPVEREWFREQWHRQQHKSSRR